MCGGAANSFGAPRAGGGGAPRGVRGASASASNLERGILCHEWRGASASASMSPMGGTDRSSMSLMSQVRRGKSLKKSNKKSDELRLYHGCDTGATFAFEEESCCTVSWVE